MSTADLHGVIRLLETVGGWDGFEVADVATEDAPQPDVLGDPAPRLVITLRPAAGVVKRCSQCGTPVAWMHETTVRRVRDLPVMYLNGGRSNSWTAPSQIAALQEAPCDALGFRTT